MEYKTRHIILIIIFFLLLLVLFIADLAIGNASISIKEYVAYFFGQELSSNQAYIIGHVRIPRAITALLVGAGLSVAGLQMQTLFRNPLAGPYVLGVSSGASLGVAIYVMAASWLAGIFGYSLNFFTGGGILLAAIVGALGLLLIIVLLSFRISDSVSLLIVGIMFGGLSASIVSVLQFFSTPELVHRFVIWSLGSLGSTDWPQLKVMAPIVLLGIFLAFLIVKPMDMLLLGESHAHIAGVPVIKSRIWIVIGAGAIAGTITAYAGPIAFVGIAVPHISRIVFGVSTHKQLMPAVVIMGGSLMLVCDIISQLPGKTAVLPINAVTAMFGAPVVIFLILKRKKLHASF